MQVGDVFKVLETESCEAIKSNIFNTRPTSHIPDFFLVMFYTTVLCSSVFSDIYVAYQLLVNSKILLLVIFVLTTISRLTIELFLERKPANEYLPPSIKQAKLQLIFYTFGLGSLVICRKILLETYAEEAPPVKRKQCVSLPFFHLSKDNIFYIKMYCFVYLVLKSIPQLLILPVVILEEATETTRLGAMVCILLNVVIFALGVTMIFPVRRYPRVFTSAFCIVLDGITKFMASVSACCVNVVVFAILFKKIGYYALLSHVCKFFIWVWPTWRTLGSQKISKFYFAIYFVLLTLIFSFIYIHPFPGQGKLFYYGFYLIQFLIELAIIYLSGDVRFTIISFFFTLKIVHLVFLSFFGLLNVAHKVKYQCTASIAEESRDDEFGSKSESQVWDWRQSRS